LKSSNENHLPTIIFFSIVIAVVMAIETWETEANKCKEILTKSIPQQWQAPLEKIPSADQLNVEDFPRQSGVLTDKELEITETTATGLVKKMGKGELSAEEVVIAFLKRATLGHQLVRNVHEYNKRAVDQHGPLNQS
jgi:hypothetical protein